MATRYDVDVEDLKRAALNLQIGAGISERMNTGNAVEFIDDGEEWAEGQVSDFIMVPLKPVPARGDITVPVTPTNRNYPREFIQAVIYFALGRLLHSEYFENEPNVSQAGDWAESMAWTHISEFRSRPTFRVGAGRRRHPNPHMPPNIAPKEERPQQPGIR